MRLGWVGLIGCLALAGCGGDDDGAKPDGGMEGDAGAVTGAVAVLAPPESGPVGFLDVPFPSDLYLDADGHVDIGEMRGYPDYVANGRIELSMRTAFCRNCTVTFPVEGDLDPDSVPADHAPDEAASLDDAIFLVRADGESEPVPLMIDYHAATDLVVIKPRYGTVLEPGARYVAALTGDLRAADGTPLAPAPVFEAIRDGGEVSAAGERARPMVEDALEAIEARGVARERIVSATIFDTEDDLRLMREAEAIAQAADLPAVTVERVRTAEELDDLLGVPSEDRAGVEIPPADGVGTKSIVHDAMAFVVEGSFESPRVVGGEGTDIGLLRRDGDGTMTAGPTPERVPFVLVVPADVDLANVPVVLAHHGNPGHKQFPLRIGNTFARNGMAVFGYDAFQMGARAASATDEENEFRGTDEPDGIAEHSGTQVVFRELGLDGFAPENADRPDHGLAFGAQVATDLLVALRVLREGDLTAVNEADAALADLSFDPDQVHYIGQSFGGFVGLTMLPLLAGRVQAAVLMVGPSDFVENTCYGPENRLERTDTLATTVLSLRGPFEEVGRRLCMTPTFDLARWLYQPFAPVESLHFALTDPIREQEPPDVLMYYAEYDELLGNSSGEHVLGVAGVPVHGPVFFIDPPVLETPLSANLETPNGTITAGGWIWSSDHSVIRVKNTTVRWETPFFPPFVELDEPRDHVNPIEDAHAMASHFFETRRATGRAEIANPADL